MHSNAKITALDLRVLDYLCSYCLGMMSQICHTVDEQMDLYMVVTFTYYEYTIKNIHIIYLIPLYEKTCLISAS